MSDLPHTITSYLEAAQLRQAHPDPATVRAISGWIPHPLSSEELQVFRQATFHRIHVIQSMEAHLARAPPEIASRLQVKLTMARRHHWHLFFRIFRVNDLPSDILTNIFRYVVWSSISPDAAITWRLWLTWTCRHWRTVTLEDPTLWSTLWFRDPPPFNRSMAWFNRAGSTPLDIRISDRKDRKLTDKELGLLLDRIFSKISSIRMLIVAIEDWEPVLVVLDKLRTAGEAGAQINIERFELHRTGTPYIQMGAGYEPSSFREPMALFGGVYAPSLRHFTVDGIHIDWQRSTLTNLTTIDIRRIPIELCPRTSLFRDLLSSSPALHKLCLDGAGPQPEYEEARSLPPIRLNHLKILVIADSSVSYSHYIFSQIIAPNVRDLSLLNFGGEDYSSLFAMLISRFPEVRILTAYAIEATQTATFGRIIIKWLESMPLLSYLRIANVKSPFLDLFFYDPRTFQDLRQAQSGPQQILCPKLTILECQAVDPNMIATWGVSRRKLGVPLNKVYLTPDWANKLTREQYATLNQISTLYILNKTMAPEEKAIME